MSIIKMRNLYVKVLGSKEFGIPTFDRVPNRDEAAHLINHCAINLAHELRHMFKLDEVVIENV
jgi:hypothetical protein